MQLTNDRLLLSASDLVAFMECEHLSALDLRAAPWRSSPRATTLHCSSPAREMSTSGRTWRACMQLCLCSELLAAVQGRSPEWMHVVSGSGERHSFRVDEFSAFYRRLRRRYEVRLAEGAPLSSSRATIGSIAARADSLA